MKRVSPKIRSLLLVVCLCSLSLITIHAAPAAGFSEAELDEIFAPIALYPDPLLAQIVPAATFTDQLQAAQKTLNGSTDDELIASQSWDVSVKSVAHYPEVLQKMVSKIDWTTAVGQAYVNQPSDVSKSIQRLRAEANAAGNLVSTSQQQVEVAGDVIKIVPAEPQVIYVPQYNAQTVYQSGPSTGAVVAARAISFTAGMAMGAWLNNDWDYSGRGVYYHGWNGGGWVGASRGYVNVNRNVYVNNSFSNVSLNRAVANRNISGYRSELTRNSVARQNNINNLNRNRANPNNTPRNNAGRNDLGKGNAGRNDAGRSNSANRKDAPRTNAGRNDAGRNTAATRDANRANTSARGGTRTETRNSPNASKVGANSGGHKPATTSGHKPATTGTHSRTSGSSGNTRATKSGGAKPQGGAGGSGGRKRP